jgi:hypothetical protein
MSVAYFAERTAVAAHHRMTRRSVVYRRGEVEILVDLSPLSLGVTVDQGEGARIRQTVPHWLILPGSLDFGSGASFPQTGDQIVDGSVTYAVEGLSNGQAWEWETAHQLRMKVRTVAVG